MLKINQTPVTNTLADDSRIYKTCIWPVSSNWI